MTRQEWARQIAAMGRQARTRRREGRIEDYQYIGGPRLTNQAAATRLGVSKRTVQRYRRELREQAVTSGG